MLFFAQAREKMFYLPESSPDFVFPIVPEPGFTYLVYAVLLLGIAAVMFLWFRRKRK